jgi:hypothetical protein
LTWFDAVAFVSGMFEFFLSLAIRLASAAVLVGWLLSAMGELNPLGYLLAGVPVILAMLIFARPPIPQPMLFSLFKRLSQWWKYRRILPLIYCATLFLIVLGSVLHEPNNFDGLSYRIPKVLYWLGQQHWHFIDAPYAPINHTLPNYEWLTVPFFLVSGGFYSTVIINWIAFLFIPPLFFSLLRAFGTSNRFAYDWMWVFPTGYLIAMQAGGIGNDLLGLTVILAGLHCARRFVATGRNSFLFDALLAAGFCTGIKLSNLPLAAFVLIILLKNTKLMRGRTVILSVAIPLAALISALIPMILNFIHSGSILGTTTGEDQTSNPVAGFLGNSLIMLVAAFAPPIFPGANKIAALLEHQLPGGLLSWLHEDYAKFSLRINELPQEENGALGLGITLAIILCLVLRKTQGCRPNFSKRDEFSRWQRLAWWGFLAFSLLVLFAKLGTGPAFPRNLLPWFPLLLVPVLSIIGCERISRSRLWRVCSVLICLSVSLGLLLTPSRPLIPPKVLFRAGEMAGLSSASLERLRIAYDVYEKRADPFTEIKNALPPEVKEIGLISDGSEPTAAWWKPYNSRRCVYLLSDEKISAAREAGLQYVVIEEAACQKHFNMDSIHWLETQHAMPIKTADIKIFATQPPWTYTLVKFKPLLHSDGPGLLKRSP